MSGSMQIQVTDLLVLGCEEGDTSWPVSIMTSQTDSPGYGIMWHLYKTTTLSTWYPHKQVAYTINPRETIHMEYTWKCTPIISIGAYEKCNVKKGLNFTCFPRVN